MIYQLNAIVVLLNFLQLWLDKLIEMIDLLELASGILIHLPIACENMQLFK